jgi:hypothetical protein
VEFYELFLPDRLSLSPLELAAQGVAEQLAELHPSALEQFFANLLDALRQLEASQPSRTKTRRRGGERK